LKRLPEAIGAPDLAKVESFTTVSQVSILGWATASNERAVANARVAAVECSRRRLERAEVAQAVAELTASYAPQRALQRAPRPVAEGRDMRARAGSR